MIFLKPFKKREKEKVVWTLLTFVTNSPIVGVFFNLTKPLIRTVVKRRTIIVRFTCSIHLNVR